MIKVKRKSQYRNFYHPNMGRILVQVTKIHKTFLGLNIYVIHQYRETYHGKIKDVEKCILSKV